MIAAIFYVIIGAFVLYALLPYFDKNLRNKRIEAESPELTEYGHRKNEILSSLNDLEFDFRMKKISEPDYLQLKEKLTQDYINIKKKLDQLSQSSGKNHAAGLENRKRETERVGS